MAFSRRSSSILRSTLTRLYEQQQGQQANTIINSSSPLRGARFMCSVPSTKLFIGGLAWGMDENALREAFLPYGEVAEAKVVVDRETGRSKGFGFVSFTCTDHAEAAIKGLDGTTLSGRSLRVNYAIEKQRGFGSFGGFEGAGSGFGSPRGDSPPGNFGSHSGAPSSSLFIDGLSSGDSSNLGGSSFFSDDSFGKDNNSSGNVSLGNDSNSKGSSFFGKDAFDESGEDSLGRDDFDTNENFAQSR